MEPPRPGLPRHEQTAHVVTVHGDPDTSKQNGNSVVLNVDHLVHSEVLCGCNFIVLILVIYEA